MAAGTTILSNFVHQCVCNDKKESLFFIKASTAPADNRAQMLVYLADQLKMNESEADETINSYGFTTGFVIGESETHLEVLTSAHLFDKYYSAEVQLTVPQIRQWFEVSVVCQHYEDHVTGAHPDIYENPDEDIRVYSPAAVITFDQARDLMTVQVSKNLLRGTNSMRCSRHHPALGFATRVPKQTDDVVMVSWPPCRDDTPVIGQVVKESRAYGQLTRDLSKGYTMRLIELNITGGAGSSGGPIFNHRGRVISVFHGVLNKMGYGVSLDDIRDFLGLPVPD